MPDPILEEDTAFIPSAFPGRGELVSEQTDFPEDPVSAGVGGEPALISKLGGLIEVAGTDTLRREDEARERAAAIQNMPVIQGVAAYIRERWDEAKSAKEQTVEQRMLSSLRQRRGEYDPDVLAKLQEQHSSMVFMHITSNKCRSAAAWLRDALGDMPWACEPTPVSDIEPSVEASITNGDAIALIQQMLQFGYQPTEEETRRLLLALKDEKMSSVQEVARRAAERMTKKMQDQLIEGGFEKALDEFIDDLVTFPAAILKGPVVRARPALKWVKNQLADGTEQWNVELSRQFRLEWERVSPFDVYPAPDASDVDDGYLIERHRLSRNDLQALREVEGYSPEAIDGALAEYKRGHIDEQMIDAARQAVEGKEVTGDENPSRLIEALQFWGPVPGSMLVEWGMDPMALGSDFDPLTDYNIEAWLVGSYVIKLQLNPDPLNRKPYYKTSWENIPGSFWGNSIPDLCRDAQRVCNAAARAMVDNMSIASGPQVVIDTEQIPVGTDITEMYPWKIWLVNSARSGSGVRAPVSFFQPTTSAGELMQVYNQFSILADEQTGIPRYMTGSGTTGGAGRTASGMSMLMSNAGKSIKSVVASVDNVIKPAIERLYFYNMMYGEDNDLKGDVNIVARGALNLMQKEAQQQRLNEFLTITLTNPIVSQLVGPEGTAYMLRQVADKLGLDVNKIIPSPEMLRVQQYVQQQMMAQQMMMQQQMAQQGTPPNPQNQTDNRRLMNGEPRSDTKAV